MKTSSHIRILSVSALSCLTAVTSTFATNGSWSTSSTSGNWSDTTKWIGGNIADGSGAVATFNRTSYSNSKTITLDSNRSLGQILALNDNAGVARNVIIAAGSGTLSLDNGASNAIISNSGQGALAINPAISLLSSAMITNTSSNSTSYLALGGPISAGSAGLKTITFGASTQRINIAAPISDGLGQIAVAVNVGNSTGEIRVTTGQSFSGGLTLSSGKYRLFSGADATSLGTGTVTLNGGSTEFFSGFTGTIVNNLVVDTNGGAIETLSSASVTWNGSITGSGTLDKRGVGTLLIGSQNTYSGNITVTEGTLQTTANGTLGTADVSVLSGQTLTLGNSLSLDSSAILTFDITSLINLDYSGTMVIGDLGLGSTFIANGIYNTSQLNSFFGGSNFSGIGSIEVVPEPRAYALFAVAGLFFLVIRRRRKSKASSFAV